MNEKAGTNKPPPPAACSTFQRAESAQHTRCGGGSPCPWSAITAAPARPGPSVTQTRRHAVAGLVGCAYGACGGQQGRVSTPVSAKGPAAPRTHPRVSVATRRPVVSARAKMTLLRMLLLNAARSDLHEAARQRNQTIFVPPRAHQHAPVTRKSLLKGLLLNAAGCDLQEAARQRTRLRHACTRHLPARRLLATRTSREVKTFSRESQTNNNP